MTYIFPPHPQTLLPIVGSDQFFPVRRIFCVGKNYADHIIEMGGDPNREEPFFFVKPTDAVCVDKNVPFPPRTDNFHFEMELVIAIGTSGSNIAAADAHDYIFGYGAGVDLTRRDLQGEAKKRGRPWAMGKSFDHSAPMSPLQSVKDIGHPESGRIHLSVNGETKQDGDLAQQVWKVPEIIANLSTYVELAAGDLIMTGTPAGVGPLSGGDKVVGEIEGVGSLAFTLGPKPKGE
ncbi:MAG: fumarylacetoacetate hydrolase family protein [Rhizobiaceae bacterium]